MTDVLNYTENYDVFLSYRRDGGETMAILLRDRLAAKGYKVFLDVENLNSGSFNKKLLGVIEGCTDVVVICSKGGLDRCINDGDWVRTEVAHAFEHGKNVVPILLRGFEWPDVLPDDIEALRMQNGINANSNEYFDAALDRLAKFLQSSPQGGGEKPVAAKRPEPGAGAGGRAGEQPKPKKPLPGKAKGAIIAAALVAVAALVLGGVALWGNLGGGGGQDDLQAQGGDDSQASMDVPTTGSDTTPDNKSNEISSPGILESNIDGESISKGDLINLASPGDSRLEYWNVLDLNGDRALIILDEGYAYSDFNFSAMRKDLNGYFLSAIDSDIRQTIFETEYTFGTQTYTDKVFLLSPEQVELYMPGIDHNYRFQYPLGSYKNSEGWWLYGATDNDEVTKAVIPQDIKAGIVGNTFEITECNNSEIWLVRPAMWIKIKT